MVTTTPPRHRWWAAAAGTVLVLSGCSSDPSPPEQPTVPEGLRGFYEQQLDWTACEGRSKVDCATLSVPVDYTHPDGERLDLALIRAPATGAERIGSLVVNAGGPGIALVDSPYFPLVSRTAQEGYDVVAFDPRGTGRSRELECLDPDGRAAYDALDGTPDTPEEVAALVEANRDYVAACEEADPGLLPFLGTRETVQDLDVLRAALGEEKLSYYGLSYGSMLGARYAAIHPDRVGRMALDSLVPDVPDHLTTWVHDRAVNLEAALDRAIGYCLDGGSCPLGDDVAGARARLTDFLDVVDADPVDTGPTGVLTREVALSALDNSLGSGVEGYGRLVRSLAAAYDGSPVQLLGLAEPDDDSSPDDLRAVVCLDGVGIETGTDDVAARAEQWSREAPVFGAAYAWLASTWCTGWPAPTLAGSDGPTSGTGPILLVSSTLDPWTPPADADLMATLLPEAVLLRYEGAEHFAYAWSPCVQEAVDAYLLYGTVPAQATCPDRTSGG